MEWDFSLTPNFSPDEMRCKCSYCQGALAMNGHFMEILQRIRNEFGAMPVISGYRCPQHPEEVGKIKPGSHSAGLAADIKINLATDRWQLVKLAFNNGIVGVGVAKTFIHLDAGHPWARRPAMWSY